MAWEYDKFKAQILFTHMLRASRKFEEKHKAKEELVGSLKKISKFKVNREFKKEINALKSHIDNLMDKQSVILKKQTSGQGLNDQLRKKIHDLERKLGLYIEEKKEKNKRIAELEQRIKARQARQQAVGVIQGELEGLETVYANLRATGQLTPSQLQKLEGKISLLKGKMQGMQ